MEELLGTAASHADPSSSWGGDYITRRGSFEGVSVPDEFWVHFERVRNMPVPLQNRNNFFSCSC